MSVSEKSGIITVGYDNGVTVLFDLITSEVLNVLHSRDGPVTAVVTRDKEDNALSSLHKIKNGCIQDVNHYKYDTNIYMSEVDVNEAEMIINGFREYPKFVRL